jgi:hypothetical protein
MAGQDRTNHCLPLQLLMMVVVVVVDSWDLWSLYIIQLGWYVHCTYAHLFLDKRKKDFVAMLIHHIVTLALLYGSFVVGYVDCESWHNDNNSNL